MKKRQHILISFFCLCSLYTGVITPETAASPGRINLDQLVEAAKKEGKVMIYGSVDPVVKKRLRETFTVKYQISLEFLHIEQDRVLFNKVKRERDVGEYLPDVIIKDLTTQINLLKPEGILDPMEPLFVLREVADQQRWRRGFYFADEDRMIKPMLAVFTRFVIRNTDQVPEGGLSSFRNLVDNKWKGRIVLGDPTTKGPGSDMFTFLTGVWGRSQTVEFMRHLVKQGPVIVKESRTSLEWVAQGTYPIGIGLGRTFLPEFRKSGLPLASVWMDEGGKLDPGESVIAVVNRRPHPNAAALFVNWVLSREGQTVWSKASGLPSARLDITNEWVHQPFMPMAGEKAWVINEGIVKTHEDRLKLNREIFEPLLD